MECKDTTFSWLSDNNFKKNNSTLQGEMQNAPRHVCKLGTSN
jgi:hypothetical protein